MKHKIHEMFEEKLTRVNTAYSSLNSKNPLWKPSLEHDVELCKMGLAYFKSGVPTPEEVRLREQFKPREFSQGFQSFKLQARRDLDYKKDFELRMAVGEFRNQRRK